MQKIYALIRNRNYIQTRQDGEIISNGGTHIYEVSLFSQEGLAPIITVHGLTGQIDESNPCSYLRYDGDKGEILTAGLFEIGVEGGLVKEVPNASKLGLLFHGQTSLTQKEVEIGGAVLSIDIQKPNQFSTFLLNPLTEKQQLKEQSIPKYCADLSEKEDLEGGKTVLIRVMQ